MNVLTKYLEKIGVSSVTELNKEEREVYRGWEAALDKHKVTDEDVANFLVTEEDRIVTQLIQTDNSDKLDIFLKMQLDMIRRIKGFLRTPELERKMTEQNLINLIKQ